MKHFRLFADLHLAFKACWVERQELYSAHCVTMEKLEYLVKGLFPRSTEQFVILEAVVDDLVVTLYHWGL